MDPNMVYHVLMARFPDFAASVINEAATRSAAAAMHAPIRCDPLQPTIHPEPEPEPEPSREDDSNPSEETFQKAQGVFLQKFAGANTSQPIVVSLSESIEVDGFLFPCVHLAKDIQHQLCQSYPKHNVFCELDKDNLVVRFAPKPTPSWAAIVQNQPD